MTALGNANREDCGRGLACNATVTASHCRPAGPAPIGARCQTRAMPNGFCRGQYASPVHQATNVGRDSRCINFVEGRFRTRCGHDSDCPSGGILRHIFCARPVCYWRGGRWGGRANGTETGNCLKEMCAVLCDDTDCATENNTSRQMRCADHFARGAPCAVDSSCAAGPGVFGRLSPRLRFGLSTRDWVLGGAMLPAMRRRIALSKRRCQPFE